MSTESFENQSALVLEHGGRAVVLHRAGASHPNAVAARARLAARGFTLCDLPIGDARKTYLATLPNGAFRFARALLAALARAA